MMALNNNHSFFVLDICLNEITIILSYWVLIFYSGDREDGVSIHSGYGSLLRKGRKN